MAETFCEECSNPDPVVKCHECDGCELCCECESIIQVTEEMNENDSIGG